MKFAVVGAGIAGRYLAWLAGMRGHQVVVYDAGRGCSEVAAGQLAPYCELESASRLVHEWGVQSLAAWEKLGGDFFFQRAGTVVVATERADLQRLAGKLPGDFFKPPADLEPELGRRFHEGLYFPNEGQLDAAACLTWLRTEARAEWRGPAGRIASGEVDGERFDAVADCRGLGARAAWGGLRGVRGELVRVHAPEVGLTRPVRLFTARFSIYAAPRPESRFVIGATCLETESTGPLRVRSALELLSAAYALHPGFGEAAIEGLVHQLRPALADHDPHIQTENRLVRINGLYRHGFLLAPKVCELALQALEGA